MKNVKKVLFIFIAVLLAYYVICQIITLPVNGMVKGLFYGEERSEQIDDIVYEHFPATVHERYKGEPYNVNLELRRMTALYFPNTGYVWYKYTSSIEQNGEEHESSHNCSIYVKIKLNKNGWYIEKIWEPGVPLYYFLP